MTLHPPGPQGHFLTGSILEFTADTLAFLLDSRQIWHEDDRRRARKSSGDDVDL